MEVPACEFLARTCDLRKSLKPVAAHLLRMLLALDRDPVMRQRCIGGFRRAWLARNRRQLCSVLGLHVVLPDATFIAQSDQTVYRSC